MLTRVHSRTPASVCVQRRRQHAKRLKGWAFMSSAAVLMRWCSRILPRGPSASPFARPFLLALDLSGAGLYQS